MGLSALTGVWGQGAWARSTDTGAEKSNLENRDRVPIARVLPTVCPGVLR